MSFLLLQYYIMMCVKSNVLHDCYGYWCKLKINMYISVKAYCIFKQQVPPFVSLTISAFNSMLGQFRPALFISPFLYVRFFKGTLYGPLLTETQIQTDRRGNQHSVCQSHTIKTKCLLFPGVISHIHR